MSCLHATRQGRKPPGWVPPPPPPPPAPCQQVCDRPAYFSCLCNQHAHLAWYVAGECAAATAALRHWVPPAPVPPGSCKTSQRPLGGSLYAPAARSTVRPIRVDERLLPPHLFRPVPSAKKPTFEPTNPSQSVARSCTPFHTAPDASPWTGQNATARDNLTRAATLWSYLRIRRL